MSYLLDTNILSETLKASPNKKVIEWLLDKPSDAMYISVLTLGEIRKGIEMASNVKRKEKLLSWLEHDLTEWFGNNIINIDADVADRWGFILANSNRPIPAIDSLIAASALAFNLKVVTRNVSDFDIAGLEVINPW